MTGMIIDIMKLLQFEILQDRIQVSFELCAVVVETLSPAIAAQASVLEITRIMECILSVFVLFVLLPLNLDHLIPI